MVESASTWKTNGRTAQDLKDKWRNMLKMKMNKREIGEGGDEEEEEEEEIIISDDDGEDSGEVVFVNGGKPLSLWQMSPEDREKERNKEIRGRDGRHEKRSSKPSDKEKASNDALGEIREHKAAKRRLKQRN
jgi:hypothetical protein